MSLQHVKTIGITVKTVKFAYYTTALGHPDGQLISLCIRLLVKNLRGQFSSQTQLNRIIRRRRVVAAKALITKKYTGTLVHTSVSEKPQNGKSLRTYLAAKFN